MKCSVKDGTSQDCWFQWSLHLPFTKLHAQVPQDSQKETKKILSKVHFQYAFSILRMSLASKKLTFRNTLILIFLQIITEDNYQCEGLRIINSSSYKISVFYAIQSFVVIYIWTILAVGDAKKMLLASERTFESSLQCIRAQSCLRTGFKWSRETSSFPT